MTNLRTLAAGQPCRLRLPEFCRRNAAYTVLAHIRRAHVAGVGQKPPDLIALPACDCCHDVVDGRNKQDIYTRAELDSEILRGLCEWLAFLWQNEVVIVALPRR